MATAQKRQGIPVTLSAEQFDQFVLPHLTAGSRGPRPKLSLYKSFNYILKLLYTGCQWKELPIEKDETGKPEIHYTRIYMLFRRLESAGCIAAIFVGSVFKLHESNFLYSGSRNSDHEMDELRYTSHITVRI